MWKEWKDELPTFAGVALVVIALAAVVAKWDVSAPEAVLAMFGAALVAAPVIAKIKIGAAGSSLRPKSRRPLQTYPMSSISTRRPSRRSTTP